MIRHIVYRFQQFIGTVMNSCTLLKKRISKDYNIWKENKGELYIRPCKQVYAKPKIYKHKFHQQLQK